MVIPVKEKNVKLTVKRNFYDKTNSLKKRTAGEERERMRAIFFVVYIVKRGRLYYNTYICKI